jgi:hypothetical protein
LQKDKEKGYGDQPGGRLLISGESEDTAQVHTPGE